MVGTSDGVLTAVEGCVQSFGLWCAMVKVRAVLKDEMVRATVENGARVKAVTKRRPVTEGLTEGRVAVEGFDLVKTIFAV